jgi:hypothetical protein
MPVLQGALSRAAVSMGGSASIQRRRPHTFSAWSTSFAAALMLCSPAVSAQNYVGESTLSQVRTQQTFTYVGLATQPANTCASYGAHFRFDHTTPDGKALLAWLLLAQGSGRSITAWYTTTTAPGAVDSACTSYMSLLTGVRVL